MIKVEVGQYRPIKKEGPMKATFSVVIYPYAQKILDCKHLFTSGKHWFTFPQFKIRSKDGTKDEYIPYISFGDKEYLQELKDAVMVELMKHVEQTAVEIDCPF